MKLRRNQYCPIHRSLSCCVASRFRREGKPEGLECSGSRTRTIREDTASFASKAEMRKLLDRKIVEQNRQCAICQVAFTNYNDIVPDHMDPRGMGGSRRDDHPENIQAVHWWCNGEKGSTPEY